MNNETKQMLEVIERNYLEANNEYNKYVKKINRRNSFFEIFTYCTIITMLIFNIILILSNY